MTGGPFYLDKNSGYKFRKHSASSGKVFQAQRLVSIQHLFGILFGETELSFRYKLCV